MDILADILSVTRLGTTMLAQAELIAPWGLEVDPIAEAHVHAVQRESFPTPPRKLTRPLPHPSARANTQCKAEKFIADGARALVGQGEE
jgi:hypothetical protein